MKFTKEQLTQIISEGITKGIAKSQNFKFLTENTKIKIGMQGANVDPKAPGDTKRVGRYIDNLDNVAEFISAVPMFIEYLLEYKEEKASIDHLRKIVEVCNLTPNVKHWLPTREYKIVNNYMKQGGKIPTNLVIRFSAHMIDQKPPKTQLNTSTIHKNKTFYGVECESYKNNNECGSCRLCWDHDTKNISYKYH